MTGLQKLLLVPCLSPLLMALTVASLNGTQPTSLRFLTWRSSKLPIGAWIALASTGAALFSGLTAFSASAGNRPLRRQVHRSMDWGRRDPGVWAQESEPAPFTPIARRWTGVHPPRQLGRNATSVIQPRPWPCLFG